MLILAEEVLAGYFSGWLLFVLVVPHVRVQGAHRNFGKVAKEVVFGGVHSGEPAQALWRRYVLAILLVKVPVETSFAVRVYDHFAGLHRNCRCSFLSAAVRMPSMSSIARDLSLSSSSQEAMIRSRRSATVR